MSWVPVADPREPWLIRSTAVIPGPQAIRPPRRQRRHNGDGLGPGLTAGAASSGAAWHALPGEFPGKAFLPVRKERGICFDSQMLVRASVSLRGYGHRRQEFGQNLLLRSQAFPDACHWIKKRAGSGPRLPSTCFPECPRSGLPWLSCLLTVPAPAVWGSSSLWDLVVSHRTSQHGFRDEAPQLPVFSLLMNKRSFFCLFFILQYLIKQTLMVCFKMFSPSVMRFP